MVKPAMTTPLSCLRFVAILREAGLPEGWCQTLILAEYSTRCMTLHINGRR